MNTLIKNQIFSHNSGFNNETVEKVRQLKHYLEELNPCYLPEFYDFEVPDSNSDLYHESYKTNSSIEQSCLDYVSAYKRQFKRVFPSRKSLLLTPKNECGVKKFITTYIFPVKWSYPEFYNWEGAASFVSDHLNYLPLIPCTQVPNIIYSSTTILKLQKGNSFDYSILLCSLLLGYGFDAYVVSGYATREICYMNQTRDQCPFLKTQDDIPPATENDAISKYVVKPIKTFQSQYDLKRIAKELKEDEDQYELSKKRNEELIKESEKPPIDPLFGLRVHAWVLIKSGLRDITEDFFIEPFTGTRYEIGNKLFLGIENIFNDQNYWLNKYYCGNGIEGIKFDLQNLINWEPIFMEDKPETVLIRKNTDEEIKSGNDDKLHDVIVPLSWVKNLFINEVKYEKRYPMSQKQRNYYKTQFFQYSPYFCLSGLMMRVKIFEDTNYTKILEVQEYIEKRDDFHYKTIIRNNRVQQYFDRGNEFSLKEYNFEKYNPGPENNKEITFYENTRVDGLIKRVETSLSMEETYFNRKDFLESFYVKFFPRDPTEDLEKQAYRTVQYIVKKFRRNYALPAEEDIAELVFKLTENKIKICYHVDTFSVIPSTREFIKPEISTDGKNTLIMEGNTHTSFKSNPLSRTETNLEIYELIKRLINEEKKALNDVRTSERDTNIIIQSRMKAIRHDKLYLSLFDTIRNNHATQKRKEIEMEFVTMTNKEEEKLDFLGPFLAQYANFEVKTREQAFQVREACLLDLKKRLIKQANLIKDRFERETDALQKKQIWYYQNKLILSLEEEHNYLDYCANTVSLLDTLENLLLRHKQSAPHKYMLLERKIRNDLRMIEFM